MTDRRCRMETTGGRRSKAERRSDDVQSQLDRLIWDACRAATNQPQCRIWPIAKDCIAKIKAIQEAATKSDRESKVGPESAPTPPEVIREFGRQFDAI